MSKFTGCEQIIRNRSLVSLQINLLNKCTSRCVYCRKYEWPNVSIDFTRLKEVLQYLKHNEGLQTVVFSGGDPLLYEHLVELLSFCKNLGLKVSLITTLLTGNMEKLNAIATYADRISVSMDAKNAEDYMKLRGVNGFDLAVKNIKYVNDIRNSLGLQVIRFSTTVSLANVTDMLAIYEIAKSTNSKINFYCVHTHDAYILDDYDMFYSIGDEIAKLDVNHISNASTLRNKSNEIKSKYCNICKIHAVIDATGDVYPCCHLLDDNGEYNEQVKYSYGNINYEPYETVFDRRKNIKYSVQECGGCVDRYKGLIDEINDILNSEDTYVWL